MIDFKIKKAFNKNNVNIENFAIIVSLYYQSEHL